MKQRILVIKENNNIAEDIFELVLEGDIDEHLPGQFVNIKVPGKYLRRPLSVCDFEEERLTLCYKAVGEGTKTLSGIKRGETLDVLTCLGNGYDLESAGESPLLIGGGMGCAPLYFLAKKLIKRHTSVEVVIGFNTKNDIYYQQKFEELGCNLHIATADGSYGQKGFATDIIPDEYTYFYSCGPLPMMKAVNKIVRTPGQFSLEERMGCGFGACMGCSIKVKPAPAPGGAPASGSLAAVKSGNPPAVNSEFRIPDSELTTPVLYKRICTDGPVFKREEIIWED